MATQTATGSGPYRNNGGTIVQAGNVNTTSGPVKVDNSLMENATGDKAYGSKVQQAGPSPSSSGNLGTVLAVDARPFAYQQQAGSYVMRRVTTTIAGSGDTTLQTGASDFGHRANPLRLETTRDYGSGSLTSWDYVTGAITKGANAGEVTAFGDDHAARPTNAIPGELVYMFGAIEPNQDDYAPRTG